MPESVTLEVNGARVIVPRGTSVAAAILAHGSNTFRQSVSGAPRGPLCGMGICFECRLTIDGRRHARSCQIFCEDGMSVQTDG